jgi:hypothetical protein
MRIRRNYKSFKTLIVGQKDEYKQEDTTTSTFLTKIEDDVYKMDFTVDNQQCSILIRKSTEHDNIEGIYTDDYNDCVTSEVKPFFAFCQDKVCPSYINKIFNRQDTNLIITLRNKEERTIITDSSVISSPIEYDVSDTNDTSDSDKDKNLYTY